MPRMREIVDYFSDESESGEKRSCLIDVPQQDWCASITIDLQPDHFVQLKKNDDGTWNLATSLSTVKEMPKKQSRKQASSQR